MSTRKQQKQQASRAAAVDTLVALGIDPDLAAEIIGGVAPASSAKPKANTFHEKVIKARIPCAYGVESCGRFAPNGVGSRQHTTCPKGRKALASARK